MFPRKLLPLVLMVPVFALLSAMSPACAHAFGFSNPSGVDNARPASEPGINVDTAGRIFVNAPGGFPAVSYIWRSTDGGNTFAYVGPVNAGGSTTGSDIGGGDSNLATDALNDLYFIDLWLGNSTTAVSTDSGANWFAQPFGTVPIQDRPWVSADPTTANAGMVYSVTEQLGTGIFLSIAKPVGPIPSGLVYPISILEVSDQARGLIGTAPAGPMATNQKGDTYNVYSVFTGSNGSGIGLAKLPSGSLTATNSNVAPAMSAYDQTQAFPVVAVDSGVDDNVYVVWTDPTPSAGWKIRYASYNGSTWSSAVTLGYGVYPWITADAPGKVDIGWYSAARAGYTGDPNAAPSGTVWDVDFAQSLNALSSPATFTTPVQAATAVKTGAICTQGANCSADRELGDFMSITHDGSGNALLSYVVVPSPGTGDVHIAVQNSGTVIK